MYLFDEHKKPSGKIPEKDAAGRTEQIFSKKVSVAASLLSIQIMFKLGIFLMFWKFFIVLTSSLSQARTCKTR